MNRLICGIAALAVLLVVPSVCSASLNEGDVIRFTDGPGTTNGGEYGVYLVSGGAELFRTFCIEKNEYLNFGSNQFVIDSITQEARNGGLGGGNPDPLDPRTKWLYFNFYNGTLAGYDYVGAGRDASANALQNAIWGLEDEIALDNSNVFVKAANQASASDLAAAADRVYVLNLKWVSNGDNAQDVLYVIPGAVTPEPAAVVVWSALTCAGLLFYRRDRMRKSA